MKTSKRHSIRLSNGPLKSLAHVGSNMTVVEHGDITILYSYETPVALLAPGGGYMTGKKWSTTTSKHIGKFFAAYGYDKRGAQKLPQEDIEAIARAGAESKPFPINVDPTPAETREVVRRLTRRGDNPRRKRPKYGSDEVFIDVWEERDRLHIAAYGYKGRRQDRFEGDGELIAEWWDDDARQMIEDGFFTYHHRFDKAAVVEYLYNMGLIWSD